MVNIEDRVAALMTDANPVPDYDQIEIAAEATAYLVTLSQRSSEVTQLDTKQKDQKQKKTVRQRWLVAAAIIILAGVALLFINQNGESPVADQPTTGPAATIEAYITAYNAGDIDAVMELFSEESTMTGAPYGGPSVMGKDQIRQNQIGQLSASAADNAYTISNVKVTGKTVTWDHVFVSRSGQKSCVQGQSVVIEDGKILTWTWPDTDFACS